MDAKDLSEGAELHATYRLTRLLGQGGMGAVFEAEHMRLPRRVAVKFLLGNGAASPELAARFRREAEIASRLVHPNIVDVHDYNTLDDGTPYLVMELLDGEDLRARLSAGPMDYQQARTILLQVVSALDLAHREGIIHRDLKPENVFLCRNADGTTIAKVLDFGISKLQDAQSRMTREDVVMGTPGYMAPEQAMGRNAAVDRRTDLFSLAAIFYEMITGENVFLGETLAEVVYKVTQFVPEPLSRRAPTVPSSVSNAIAIALSKEQQQRQPSVSAFAAAFHEDEVSSATAISQSANLGVLSTAYETPSNVLGSSSHAPQGAALPESPVRLSTATAGTQVAPSTDPAASAGTNQADSAFSQTNPADTTRSVYKISAPPENNAPAVAAESAPPSTTPSSRNAVVWVILGLALGAGTVAFALKGGTSPSQPQPPAVSLPAPAVPSDSESATSAPKVAGGSTVPLSVKPPSSASDRQASDRQASDRQASDRQASDPQAPSQLTPGTPQKGAPPPAGPSPVPAVVSTAPPQDPKPAAKTAVAEAAPSASGASQEALQSAAGALAQGDYATALRLARNSLRESKSQNAYLIMTKAYCAQRDVGMSRAMHRNLGPSGRRQAIIFCQAHGIELPP